MSGPCFYPPARSQKEAQAQHGPLPAICPSSDAPFRAVSRIVCLYYAAPYRNVIITCMIMPLGGIVTDLTSKSHEQGVSMTLKSFQRDRLSTIDLG
jgi:hypothetical protein